MNALRAPEGIGEGHGADELGDLRIDGRPTGSTSPRLPVPERTEALPVPANHGLRLNDMERFAPPCPPLGEPHPEDAVEETDPRSLGAAAEQGELLSQRQVLKNEVGAGLQRSAQSAQQSEYEGHCYAGSLDRRPTSRAWRPIFWPTTGLWFAPAAARFGAAIAVALSALLAAAVLLGVEKTLPGELVAAAAMTSAGFVVTLAGGAPWQLAVETWASWLSASLPRSSRCAPSSSSTGSDCRHRPPALSRRLRSQARPCFSPRPTCSTQPSSLRPRRSSPPGSSSRCSRRR